MSEKIFDSKGRWRNKTVAFRMSPEEKELLDKLINLSGLSKQDYLINRTLQRKIKVYGNPRTFKALRDQMNEILIELRRIETIDNENSELLVLIEQIEITMDGFSK